MVSSLHVVLSLDGKGRQQGFKVGKLKLQLQIFPRCDFTLVHLKVLL